jgi:hypothetical protein
MAFGENEARDIQAALATHVKALGGIERVQEFDPTNAPGKGITACLVAMTGDPRSPTGLASSSLRLIWTVRFLMPPSQPLGSVDPKLLGKAGNLITRLAADLTLGGLARVIDLRGMAGQSVEWRFGWVEIGGTLYRLLDVTVPLIINDVFPEAA